MIRYAESLEAGREVRSLLRPREVADLIAFVISPRAGATTGTEYVITISSQRLAAWRAGGL